MRVSIWDRPLRIFHWLLVVLIGAAWWTAENGALDWHYRIGFAMLVLLVFRLVWGVIGSSTARFAGFVRGPAAIRAYLAGTVPHRIGHSPLGALSVLALLGLLSIHVALGLFSTDEDGLNPAPLSHLISYELSEAANELHEDSFDILLILIALHLAAILYYTLFKRRNLVGRMLTGKGHVPDGTEPMRPASAWRLGVASTLALAFAGWVWAGAPLP